MLATLSEMTKTIGFLKKNLIFHFLLYISCYTFYGTFYFRYLSKVICVKWNKIVFLKRFIGLKKNERAKKAREGQKKGQRRKKRPKKGKKAN